jgi:hypothetical protein
MTGSDKKKVMRDAGAEEKGVTNRPDLDSNIPLITVNTTDNAVWT